MVQKVQMDVKQQCEEEYKNKLTELRSHMQEKYAKELEATIEAERKLMTEQFDELTAILKKSAEEEQVCLTFTPVQNKIFPYIRCKFYMIDVF